MARTAKRAHRSVEERRARGREACIRTPLTGHAGWAPTADRAYLVALLQEQDATREPDLVPVRHGRMMLSPFTFYRGGAKVMAADLEGTPTSGLQVQLCGDAHLSNFGLFASPERRLLFDLNDFDETLPRPFEYDVKRMAASFTVAGRNNGFAKGDTRTATHASLAAYREAMARFAAMGTMEIWYDRLAEDQMPRVLRDATADASRTRKGAKAARRAEKTARKVVGVGSVGTQAYIVLLQGRDRHDPLFLQLKEATTSVLEDHLPVSRYRHHGQRVVCGQRLMQAASDLYLGWTEAKLPDVHHFYWRQLRDMTGSPDVETMARPRSPSTAGPAGGRWRGPMPARATRSRSPPTWVGRPVRPADGRLLRTLRRPERPGLPGIRQGHPLGRLQALEGL
jgi:uncharacterized protein (DUF2252 family)